MRWASVVWMRTYGSKLILGRVCVPTEPNRNWTGAPRSPQRTWAENDMFRLLFLFDNAISDGGASPVLFGPRTLRRTWAPVQLLLGSVRRLNRRGEPTDSHLRLPLEDPL